MEKLFGIPIDSLMIGLLFVFGLCAVALTISILRNRVMFKIAARNIPRRPAQTALIVLGLMLAAMLFSASLSTGDTITHSIRTIAVDVLGDVDIIVVSEMEEEGGRRADFDQSFLALTQQILAEEYEVEGIAPAILESVPVVAPGSQLNEPAIDLLGLDPQYMESFDPLIDEKGNQLSLENLGVGEIYISTEVVEELEVGVGDQIEVYLGENATPLTIAGVYENGGNPSEDLSLVMPISEVQSLLSKEGSINAILITNQGDALGGAEPTDAVMATLEPSLEGTGLEAEPVKQDVLEVADEVGSMFSSIFLMLGQFSIAAGILLIFLIMVMLAAERKHELGIARAVGTQRGQIIRMFTFEGILYALIASAVGSVLGLVVGWGMVQVMAAAFGEMDFEIIYHFSLSNLVIAYTLGVLITLAVVAVSAWRVSNLNIIRAIRDIPEPANAGGRNLKGLIAIILFPLMGLILFSSGIQEGNATPYLLGGSLIIIGLCLLASRLRVPDRLAYTLAGVGLLAWWLLPDHPFVGEMDQGMDLFFLSGIMLVAGAVWVVMYNSDLLLLAITSLFSRFSAIAPALRMAVSYPMASRFRTGMALAMFSLIVFTLVVMSITNASFGAAYDDTDRLSGGFDIRGAVSYINPIPDMETAIEEADSVDAGNIESTASLNGAQLDIRQADTDQEWTEDPLYLQGVDTGYTNSISYDFAMMAEGYSSPEQVWQALSNEPGLVVVASSLVPRQVNYDMGGHMSELQLEGFVIEDEVLPEVYIEARHPVTEQVQQLRVIGVLEETAVYGAMVTTSQDTLNALLPQPMLPTTYLFKAKSGVDVPELAKSIESQFLEHGMDTNVIAEEIADQNKVGDMFMNLIQGFMGLGLIVGIAALGVIAARSVVERRQQIGMLRALGFQRNMVQRTFLMESSFIALLGIGIGVALGCVIGIQVVGDSSESMETLELRIPWLRIAAIVAIAYIASLITTYLPARQAASVYPAEALRYE